MPVDLLQYLDGPQGFSVWWLVLGVVLVMAVILWCAGVFVWTMPAAALAKIPVIGPAHAQLVRRRFVRSLQAAAERYRSGEWTDKQAASAMKRTLRSFLALQTGRRVQFMHIEELSAASELAPAAPLLTALDDVQFSGASAVDLSGVGREAEELVRSWS